MTDRPELRLNDFSAVSSLARRPVWIIAEAPAEICGIFDMKPSQRPA
jgi:hypothetical protein